MGGGAEGSWRIFPHKEFSLSRNDELKQDLLLISVFFFEREKTEMDDAWCLLPEGCGKGQPTAMQGPELSHSLVRRD